MALITCKDCQKQFSTDAKKCPNCGWKRPPGIIAKTLFVLFFGPIIVSTIVVMLSPKPADGTRQYLISPEFEARSRCEYYVKQSLHDPDSAEFDNMETYPIAYPKKDVYLVRVGLRARNGFGGMRKIAVDCEVIDSKGRMNLVSLKQR